MRLLILVFMTTMMLGCAAPPIAYDHQRIIAEDGGAFFASHDEVINRPFEDVERSLRQTAPRCLNRIVDDQTVVIYGKTDRFVRFHPTKDGNGMILAYLYKLSGKPDSEAANVMVADISPLSASETRIRTYHYEILFMGGYNIYADAVLEWARDEHQMCLG